MSRIRLPSGLTRQQEQFVAHFIEIGNASEAYRLSYNTEASKPETIHTNAYRLLHDTHVALRIKRLYEEKIRQSEASIVVTVEKLTQECEVARLKAMDERNPAAAVAATMSKARLHGLLGGKRPIIKRPHDMTDEELQYVLRDALP